MSNVGASFSVNPFPDGGEFLNGNTAALKWDILRKVGSHEIPNTLDLSSCTHLKPYSVACLCALGQLSKLGKKLIHVTPPNNVECADHLARLGILDFFTNPDWNIPLDRATNFPTRLIAWPPGNHAGELLELLVSRDDLPANMFPQLESHLDEIILNALTHAHSPTDCIVVGQAFPATHKVEISIVDLGQTIRGHLSKNPEYSMVGDSDELAILKATEDMVTGSCLEQPNPRNQPNSGAGLAELRSYCENGGGELTILSGTKWITFSPDCDPVVGTVYGQGFQGCLVNTRFYTDICLNFDQVDAIL